VRLVGLLGYPLATSLSPRMQNAAFAERGLDWSYALVPAREGHLENAVAGLVELGFAGANVTTPHKLAVRALCETDLPSVNTLILRDGRIEGHSTDVAILEGLPAQRPVIVGDGGSAAAFRHALPHAAQFSRRGTWPPEVRDADLVVNTTSERDEVLVRVGRGQTLIDLPYPETATAKASREAGATIVDGLEVLVAQGAAAFELWTGVPAPVDVMRRAVRSGA
jgi:shikimate dehydrogenase